MDPAEAAEEAAAAAGQPEPEEVDAEEGERYDGGAIPKVSPPPEPNKD